MENEQQTDEVQEKEMIPPQEMGADDFGQDEEQIYSDDFDKETASYRRWFITINNPFWDNENDKEYDGENRYIENYERIDVVVNASYNKEIFDFKLWEQVKFNKHKQEYEKTGKIKRRPYFKNYEAVYNYLHNLKENRRLEFACWQYEKGELNETPHIHIFVIYDNNKRFWNVVEDFPTWDIARVICNTNAPVRDYVWKQGKHADKAHLRLLEPMFIGIFTEQRSNAKSTLEYQQAIKDGMPLVELLEKFPMATTKGIKATKEFQQVYLAEQFSKQGRNIEVFYIYGNEGVGKNDLVIEKHGYDYFELEYSEYWGTGYDNQDVLLLDEFKGQVPLLRLNRILYGNPHKMNTKGGFAWACYTKVYILSNYPLDLLYRDYIGTENEVTRRAFLRRVNHIYCMNDNGELIKEKESFFEDIPECEQIGKNKGKTRRVLKSVVYDKYGKPTTVYERYPPQQMVMITDPKKLVEVEKVFEKNNCIT